MYDATLRGFAFLAFILGLAMWCPRAAAEPATKDQRKCMDALNKGFATLAKQEGKALCGCLRDGAKGKVSGSIRECFENATSKALTRALGKVDADFDKKCTGADRDGITRLPAFGPREPGILSQTAHAKERGLMHDLFGSDIDAAVDPGDKAAANCQLAVAKALKKCQDAKLKEFNRCKHAALAGKEGAPVSSADELARTCLLDPNTGQMPDPKGKIAKLCLTHLAKTVQKKCLGQPLDQLFPGECAGATDVPACLEAAACGRVCVATSLADNLAPDFCDALTAEDPNAALDRLLAKGGGTPTSPPPDFPDPDEPDIEYPDAYLEHDGARWAKPLDLDWQEVPDSDSVVNLAAPEVTLLVNNLEDDPLVVDITIYMDAGGPIQHTLRANLTAMPRDTSSLIVSPVASGLDLDSMRFSGSIGAVAQVRSATSGELIAVEVVHEIFYHRPEGEPVGITAYGGNAMQRQFRAGDYQGLAEVDDLDGIVRISDGGVGLTSPGPVSYPNDDGGHLPGLAADGPDEDPSGGPIQ